MLRDFKKDTKFRRAYEKWLDFWVTGPLTPRRTLSFFKMIKVKSMGVAKKVLINYFPKVYLFLRNKKNKINTKTSK